MKVMNSLTTHTASDNKEPEKILSALSDHLMPKNVTLLFEKVNLVLPINLKMKALISM